MKASVIISFYNKINYLRLLLAGFERQSETDFEIIISDDGSKPEVVEEIKKIIEESKLHLVHNWHEDNGWRKNVILNSSVMLATTDYLIFVDGDCIPHRHFVKDHLLRRQPNTVVTGRRMNLSQSFTDKLSENSIADGILDNPLGLMIKNIKGGNDIEKAVRLPFSFLYPLMDSYRHGLLGCNFSIHKDELLALNGFDERYKHPAVGEDSDLERRYEMIGGVVRRVKHMAIQYHLWHKLLSREGMGESMKIYNETIANKTAYTPYGIIKE